MNGVLESHSHGGKDSEKILKSEKRKHSMMMVLAKENK